MTAVQGRKFAIISGTGFASFNDGSEGRRIVTRFGSPSSPLRDVEFGSQRVVVLARHGDDHHLPPHAINYRANLAALSQSGVDAIIGLNTVGVIPMNLHPGQLAVPDQIVDYTWSRAHTVFDGGSDGLGHIDFTEPFSAAVRDALLAAAREAEVDVHAGGVYGVTQGPRLETAAEVDRFEREGIDLLGMTLMPEAALARELGMDYACLSLIVNRAAGRGEMAIHDDIEASTLTAKMQAIRVLKQFFGN